MPDPERPVDKYEGLAQNFPGATDAKDTLESLRWKEDMLITNYDGERVWLMPCYDEFGKRIGITDCCFESAPCSRHKAIGGKH
jgi:hypothetical protein